MVGAAGIEPATPGLEIRCSIRLSYAPLSKNLSHRNCFQVVGAGYCIVEFRRGGN
jgi:hypothetical protein